MNGIPEEPGDGIEVPDGPIRDSIREFIACLPPGALPEGTRILGKEMFADTDFLWVEGGGQGLRPMMFQVRQGLLTIEPYAGRESRREPSVRPLLMRLAARITGSRHASRSQSRTARILSAGALLSYGWMALSLALWFITRDEVSVSLLGMGICLFSIFHFASTLHSVLSRLTTPSRRTAEAVAGSARFLTRLAALVAGRGRAPVAAEWRSHMFGENGEALPSRRQAREAVGFVAAAIRFRMQDAADLAWKPVDAILASRELSNLVALLAVLLVAVTLIRHGGLHELVTNLDQVAVVWCAVYGLIRAGRWWRDLEPPERQPRRKRQ